MRSLTFSCNHAENRQHCAMFAAHRSQRQIDRHLSHSFPSLSLSASLYLSFITLSLSVSLCLSLFLLFLSVSLCLTLPHSVSLNLSQSLHVSLCLTLSLRVSP